MQTVFGPPHSAAGGTDPDAAPALVAGPVYEEGGRPAAGHLIATREPEHARDERLGRPHGVPEERPFARSAVAANLDGVERLLGTEGLRRVDLLRRKRLPSCQFLGRPEQAAAVSSRCADDGPFGSAVWIATLRQAGEGRAAQMGPGIGNLAMVERTLPILGDPAAGDHQGSQTRDHKARRFPRDHRAPFVPGDVHRVCVCTCWVSGRLALRITYVKHAPQRRSNSCSGW